MIFKSLFQPKSFHDCLKNTVSLLSSQMVFQALLPLVFLREEEVMLKVTLSISLGNNIFYRNTPELKPAFQVSSVHTQLSRSSIPLRYSFYRLTYLNAS